MSKVIVQIGEFAPPVSGISTCLDSFDTFSLTDDYVFLKFNTSKLRFLKSCKATRIIHLLGTWTMYFIFCCYHRVNIAHFHAYSGYGFWEPLILSKISVLFSHKIIFHMHGGGFKYFYENGSFYKKKIIKNGLNTAQAVLSLSPAWNDYYSSIVKKNSVHILPNAINLNVIKKYRTSKNARKNIKLLFVGRIEGFKGIYELLSAVAFLKDERISLDIMGAFQNNEVKIKKIIKQYEIEDRVRFLGEVTGNDRYQHYNNADIFVLPSYWEAMPMTVIEAMAMGMPIIATKVGSLPEMISTKNGLLIECNNVRALVSSIKKISKTRHINYYQENITEVEKKYNLDIFELKVKSIYHNLLRG